MYEKFIFKFLLLKNKINKNILNKINHLIKSKENKSVFYLRFLPIVKLALYVSVSKISNKIFRINNIILYY